MYLESFEYFPPKNFVIGACNNLTRHHLKMCTHSNPKVFLSLTAFDSNETIINYLLNFQLFAYLR